MTTSHTPQAPFSPPPQGLTTGFDELMDEIRGLDRRVARLMASQDVMTRNAADGTTGSSIESFELRRCFLEIRASFQLLRDFEQKELFPALSALERCAKNHRALYGPLERHVEHGRQLTSKVQRHTARLEALLEQLAESDARSNSSGATRGLSRGLTVFVRDMNRGLSLRTGRLLPAVHQASEGLAAS